MERKRKPTDAEKKYAWEIRSGSGEKTMYFLFIPSIHFASYV
jgi:hypothetical protein